MTNLKKLMIDEPQDVRIIRERFIVKWEVSPREIRLRELGEKYHSMCEAYDRTVCTAVCRFDGKTAMPVGRWQENKVIENANNVIKMIYEEALKEGFTKEAVRRAIQTFHNQ